MEIKCDRDVLIEAVNLVQRAVSTKTTATILECILLRCTEDSFILVATDQEIGIRTDSLECEILEEGSIALHARLFSDLVKRLPQGIVHLKTNNLTVVINCVSAEFKLAGRNAEEFPELPQVERKNKLNAEQPVFKELIRKTHFSMCQDETKPNFLGALLDINDNIANMVTCDTFRVSHCSAELSCEPEFDFKKAIIPSKTVNELYRLLLDEGMLSVFITDKHVLFDIGRCVVISRLIEGEFINYSGVFPDKFDTKIVMVRASAIEAFERAALVSTFESKKNPIRLKISGGVMYISSAAETGNSYEEIQIDMEGNDIEISFNPKFLLDVVKCISSDEISFEFNTSLSPCVVKPIDETEMFRYLVLPLRLK